MFNECHELEYLDLSNFNTFNVDHMGLMFSGCYKLKEIKGLNNFDTSYVKYIYGMFQKCKELEYLDLSNFDIYNVEKTDFMFNECEKLKEIKGINKFFTYNCISMIGMFRNCCELTYLD